MDFTNFADRLREARVAQGHTQFKAAVTMDIREETVRRWEAGTSHPRFTSWEKVMNYILAGEALINAA